MKNYDIYNNAAMAVMPGDLAELSETPAFERAASGKLLKLINSENIADELGQDKLNEISIKCIDGYQIDLQSRGAMEERIDRAMECAMQVQKPKNYPWPGAANVMYPLITEAALQWAARAYPAIVQGDQVVKAKVIGSDKGMPQPVFDPMTGMPAIDPQSGQPIIQIVGAGKKQERADRVAAYMNYQLLCEMQDWEEGLDKGLHTLPITGCIFKKTYYDPALNTNVSELVYPKYFVINNSAVSIERTPRYTHVIEYYPHEILEKIRLGIFRKFNYQAASETKAGIIDDYAREDITDSGQDSLKPHVFLEQHCQLDLDDDGYPEPYVVTIHYDSGEICRIEPRFREDSIIYNDSGEIAKIEQDIYFTKIPFFPAPDGSFYDLGFGYLLLPINETVNTLINQLLDAGRLANTSCGFIGRGLRMPSGAMRLAPGEFKPLNVTGATIKDNFVQIQHTPPSMVLFQLLGLLMQAGKDISAVKDVLTGEGQGSNASPTTTLALIEQGLKMFSAIYKRVHRAMKKELDKLYKLNAIYLDEQKYFRVLDEEQAVTRQDFAQGDYDIALVSDPTVVTDMQKMARAQFLMQFMGNPMVNQQEILRRIFSASNFDKIDDLMAPPPSSEPPLDLQIKMREVELKAGKLELEKLHAELKAAETEAKIAKMAAETEKTGVETITELSHAQSEEKQTRINELRAIIDAMSRDFNDRREDFKVFIETAKLRNGQSQENFRTGV